ncbi:UBX domain-containing protein 1-like [Acyrthosiphon pisum]|uniref:UBX domain-containing protein 1 n=1 Tax=Acyrthosiphon pisum TaxID=7029 RepID=A0A8R2A5D8_ACYPI|nr:UBX domain-containing protein 1-like [Acyrthosiphon pisum]|eukprot:XP_001945424.1 PREDICTED: UBX domain-containing protein 1-like [Acyrthosiphon pisum]
MTSQETVQFLIDAGFQKEKAEKSVSMTGNQGVEPAMEWLLAHNDDKMEPSTAQEASTANTNSETNTPSATVAKCEDSNKLFADTTALDYHAIKSGHSNFAGSTEEIKPLTEDEKKEQIKKLVERLKEKRKERETKEKGEELERKKIKIGTGKEKAVAEKKLEDEYIKQIMDKKKPKKQTKDYTETKLQIRLTNGQTIVQTFNVKETMAAVRVYIELNRSDGDAPFCLITSFPRKVFTSDDYEKPLDQLGLVPSAVLIMTKPRQ